MKFDTRRHLHVLFISKMEWSRCVRVMQCRRRLLWKCNITRWCSSVSYIIWQDIDFILRASRCLSLSLLFTIHISCNNPFYSYFQTRFDMSLSIQFFFFHFFKIYIILMHFLPESFEFSFFFFNYISLLHSHNEIELPFLFIFRPLYGYRIKE